MIIEMGLDLLLMVAGSIDLPARPIDNPPPCESCASQPTAPPNCQPDGEGGFTCRPIDDSGK